MQKKPKSYSAALMDQIPIKYLVTQAQGLQQELGGKMYTKHMKPSFEHCFAYSCCKSFTTEYLKCVQFSFFYSIDTWAPSAVTTRVYWLIT